MDETIEQAMLNSYKRPTKVIQHDNVNHPKHYEGSTSLECIEAMQIAFGTEAVIDFCKCNAFKYLWRYKNKNGLEDLKKANWYCERVIILRGGEAMEEDVQLEELRKQIHVKLLVDKFGG